MDLLTTMVPWLGGAVVVLLVFISFVLNVSGTWERIPTEEELAEAEEEGLWPLPEERLVLGQFGPFVTGRREIPGGYQEFSGFMVGRTLRVSRRDHGVRSLVQQGFPEVIAKLVDGDITGKYRLSLEGGGLLLEGIFTPLKIEFTHRPPRITARHPIAPKPRRYRRLTAEELVPDQLDPEDVIAAQVENQAG